MKYRQSHSLVEAYVKRELDDARHELRRDEVRKLRREDRLERRAVRFLVRLPATRRVYFLQVGVCPVSSVMICVLIGIFSSSRQNRARP